MHSTINCWFTIYTRSLEFRSPPSPLIYEAAKPQVEFVDWHLTYFLIYEAAKPQVEFVDWHLTYFLIYEAVKPQVEFVDWHLTYFLIYEAAKPQVEFVDWHLTYFLIYEAAKPQVEFVDWHLTYLVSIIYRLLLSAINYWPHSLRVTAVVKPSTSIDLAASFPPTFQLQVR